MSQSVIQRGNVIVSSRSQLIASDAAAAAKNDRLILGHCELEVPPAPPPPHPVPAAIDIETGGGGSSYVPSPSSSSSSSSSRSLRAAPGSLTTIASGSSTSTKNKSDSNKRPPPTPFICPHCSKSFRHKSYFDYHLRTHLGERPYPCSLCEKSFFQRSKLNRHLSSCHNVNNPFYNENPYHPTTDNYSSSSNTCDVCQKSFSRLSGLQTHFQTHHEGNRPFPCPTCGKQFSGLTALKNHQKGHQGLKNILCDICGKAFLLKKYLDLHLSTTHKQRRRGHQCQKCRKEFHSAKDLNRHQLIHSNDRNFSCAVCDQRFKRKDNLNRHLKLSHSMAPDQKTEDDECTNIAQPPPISEPPTQPASGGPQVTPNPPPTIIPRQVSVIKSTHEFMMSIMNGRSPSESGGGDSTK